MKATIKESVSEVYKNTNQNAQFDKTIYNYNGNLNHIKGLKNKANTNNNVFPRNHISLKNNENDIIQPSGSAGIFIFLLILFFHFPTLLDEMP